MQPHWYEPRPLGEAQRVGLMQQQGAHQLQAIRQQQQLAAWQAQQRQRQAPPPPPMLGGGLMQGVGRVAHSFGLGMLGILAGGALGFYLGQRHTKGRLRRALENPEGGDPVHAAMVCAGVLGVEGVPASPEGGDDWGEDLLPEIEGDEGDDDEGDDESDDEAGEGHDDDGGDDEE